MLRGFPWDNICPTLHKLLAHAPGIISTFNKGQGLVEHLSEKGFEASDKFIRRYRDRLARFNGRKFKGYICANDFSQ